MDNRRFTYKLHPTTIVLRSQQINLLESQQQHQDEDEQQQIDETQQQLLKKDSNSLIPQFSIPAQIFTPQSDNLLGNRSSLVLPKNPTLLPHSHQQQQQSNLAREIEQHIQQSTQQQQSAFTGPFLLYRNPDWNTLKTLKYAFICSVIIDCILLAYLYLATTYVRALTNFKIELPAFGIIIESTENIRIVRKIFSPLVLTAAYSINALGLIGFLKKKLRLLSYFIALGFAWLIIEIIVIIFSSFLGAIALVEILRLGWFALVLWIAMKARTTMSVNWYLTSQF
jgi:hypothetical protein